MKTLSTIFFIIILSTSGKSQVNLDSLWLIWNDTNQEDTVRCKAIGDFAWDGYLFSQPDSAFYFMQLQYDFAESKNLNIWMADALHAQGTTFYVRGDYDTALEYYDQSLEIYTEANHIRGIASDNNHIGLIYEELGDYDKAEEHYEKSLALYIESGDKNGIASSLNNIGIINHSRGDLATAIEYYTKCLKIDEELGNMHGVAFTTSNIAIINREQGDLEKSLVLFEKALIINQELDDQYGVAVALNNIGSNNKELGKLNLALENYYESLKIRENIDDRSGVAESYNNIGAILILNQKYDSALVYFEKGLLINQEIENKLGISKSLIGKGLVMYEQNKYQEAQVNVKTGLELAKEIGSIVEIRDASNILYQIYKPTNQYQNALEMHELYIEMRDSILSDKNQKEVLRQEFKYNYEKQKVLDEIEHEKEQALEQAETEKQKVLTYYSLGGLVLVAVFLVFVFNRLRLTKRQNLIIEAQKKEVENQKDEVEKSHKELSVKNKEITDSIVYAKRIQSAILPPQKLVKEYLQNSFILYKPKDIVAGDFYWMEHKDGKVLFAAADCTGHGVPGAMVSVICNGGLNRSVREYGLTDPGKILDKTREIVIKEFEKSEEDVKDGMDIALCSLEGNTLKYAGAYNPLWIIRNGEIIETKASKQPIGKFDNPTPYLTHTFELIKGDSIYIFSDGFVDQFGGEKGKKFKAKAFRELLLSIQDETMENQKEIINDVFEKWKGEIEQIDDVCVIGVKIE